jgi:predicted MFS family arabinose efflux permease
VLWTVGLAEFGKNRRSLMIGEQSQTLSSRLHATFISLRNPNFRVYFAAQIGSNVGTWIQITAENWLILQLTDSGLALGITNALQFGPLVFLGLYGGVVADRFNRRRLLIISQSTLALLSAAVGLLVITDLIQLWIIWFAALWLGLIMCIDRPALSGFITDLVGEDDLPNAVALNNAVISSGRMIGPVISGLLITYFGTAPSFFVNAVSFGAIVLVLVMLDVTRLHPTRPVKREPGQVREGLSYIRQDRVLRLTVAAMSLIFIAAYNFQVVVPLVASRMLGGSSELLGVVMSFLGLGAVTGSLIIASWVKPGLIMIGICCGLLSVVHIWLSLPLGVHFSIIGIFLLGVCCGFFNVTVTSTLQVRARDDVRGRVMSTYSIGILGSALIGAPLAGTLADTVGLSETFLIIAAVCAGTALATFGAWIKAQNRRVDQSVACLRPIMGRK